MADAEGSLDAPHAEGSLDAPHADAPRGEVRPDVVVVLPAWNEAARLPDVLPELTRRYTVLVIDDGSTDGTSAVARRLGALSLRHPFNLGYGAALQTGYKWALRNGARVLVQLDADGQHPPDAVPLLVAAIESGEFDLVVGSRFIEDTGYQMSSVRRAGSRLFAALGRLAGLEVSDPTSGFQGMNRAVIELFAGDLYPSDYPDLDVLLLAHRRGLRIGERAVKMAQSSRASTLHSGFAPLYYCWRLALALWALSGVPRVAPAQPAGRGSRGG